jgi:hypothetical protein
MGIDRPECRWRHLLEDMQRKLGLLILGPATRNSDDDQEHV